jgi:hypothetical protein
VQATLVNASSDASNHVKSLAADVQRSLSIAGTSTAETITAGAREAQNTLLAAASETANQVKALTIDVQRSLSIAGTTTAEAITAGAREAQTTLITTSSEAANHVKSLAADVERTLAAVGTNTATSIVNSARDVHSTLMAASTEAAEHVKSLTADVERTLSAVGSDTATSIINSARYAQNSLTTASTETAGAIVGSAREAQALLTTMSTDTAASIIGSAREARTLMASTSTEAAGAITGSARDAQTLLTTISKETVASIFSSARDAQILLKTTSTETATSIVGSAREAQTLLDTTSSEAAAVILDSAREAQTVLTATSTDTASQLKAVSADIERAINSVAANTSDTIQASALTAQTALVSASNEVNMRVKSTSSEIERSVLAAGNSFGSTMTGKTDEIVTYVQQQAERLAQIIDSKRGPLVEAIGSKTNQLTIEVDRVTSDAMKSIEVRGQAFSRAMMGSGADVARTITSAGEVATTAIGKSLQDLELASRAAIEQSRQVSVAAVTEMQETSKILRTDTVALFERLREGNILLQEVLTGAHDNLNSLERALVTRVADFVSAMNDVTSRNGTATQSLEDQLSVFNAMTTRALQDLGSLSSQFDAHGKALIEAAAMVEQSNRDATVSISERKTTLESLVTTIDLRTADLDQRLSRFTTLLDESLAAAEERARDIARVVAETAGAGSSAISRQFEAIRANAEEERRLTTTSMHEIYQQGTQEADAMFKQSADKFANLVSSMKQMAGEMQRELEATRNELRRGVLEMPQEAAESTAQMRKVIVDQIEALAELNRIVAHHGRGLDVVSATRTTTTAVRQEEPVAVAAVGGRGEMRVRESSANSASSLPPPDLGMQPPARRTEDLGMQPAARRGEDLGMQPPARRVEAPPMGPAATDQGRDTWLSDLLSRADSGTGREAPRGRAPMQAGNPLESLSLDIARLMDRNLAAEMWDRYQRGETKAFTKRLYTPAGQKAFDEVARKYRGDRSFKQTVDRYITEFERLLDEVARDDRNPQALRSQLTSETGLVYTLLAHAAGRLA